MTGHPDSLDRVAPFTTRPRTTRRGGTRAVTGLAVILAVGAGAYAFTTRGGDPAPAPFAPPPAPVTVSLPLQRNLAQSTEFTGQFSAVDGVDLRAQVNGYLTEIHFTDGQIVHKGDLLFVIDPRPYDIQLAQAVAQYQTAAAALDLANKEVSRATTLHRSDFESGETVDQRVQAQQSAVASIDAAKAAIRAAQLNLDFTRITAPFTGRIGARQVSIGSLVSGGTGGTALAGLVSLDPLHLDFDMSEADYLAYQRYLATKQPGLDRSVTFALSDETGLPHRGVLDFIDNQVNRASGTVHARATVPNPDLLIAPGQFARLQVPVSAPRPVLLVPDSAVVTDQSTKLLMTALPDGTVVPKPIETGPLDGPNLRIITKGLAPTDQVIINGLVRIRPGAKVAPHKGEIEVAASKE